MIEMIEMTQDETNEVAGGWDWAHAAEGCLFGAEVGAAMGFFGGAFGLVGGALSGCLHGAVIGGLNL